ncbi:MAG: SPASM domain-containing protein [Candidatus Omnitrophica bacterium]|nr:SPASM domain-containing protein [Candidatus Omnitrophota bacterium]
MCNRRVMKRDVGFMEEDIFERIINEVKEYEAGVRFVRHGEPLLHPDINGMSRYVKKQGVLLFISTNGLCLTEKMCDDFIDSAVDEMRFSMQGLNKAGYDEMRIGGDYDRFVANIKMLHTMRQRRNKNAPFISLSTSVTNETDAQVEDFKKQWGKLIDGIYIDTTTFARVEHLPDIKEYIGRETLERKYKPCTEVMTKLSVNWNGDITACCKDYDGQMVIGNVREISLQEAWVSGKLNKLRAVVGQACNHAQLPMCSKCYHVSTKFDSLKEAVKNKK